jgi:hypothetical protein
MKTNNAILFSLILVISACANPSFTNTPTNAKPQTDPRDAIIGNYEYQFNFKRHEKWVAESYPLPLKQTIKVEKDPKNNSGIIVSGIHNRFSVTLNGNSGYFYKAFPNVRIRDISGFRGTITGTPDQVTLIGSFSSNGELSYRVTICGFNILSTSAMPIKKPEKNNFPN